MTKGNTGFDAFFKAVSSSPEFNSLFERDGKQDYGKALKDMEENVAKASDIVKSFNDTFATSEAIETGNKLIKDASSNEEKNESKIEIKYFTKKNEKTWGFNGVAGLANLKEELRNNFIKPLKFKFKVEELMAKENDETDEPKEKIDEEKEKYYKKLYEEYKKFKVGIPTGMLFYGPPGTGKTFLTKKLAEELGAGFIEKSVGEFGSSYLHETSKNIREFFTQAKKASESGPIILFLDEIDSLVSKRTTNHDAHKTEEISQFLQEFNKLEEAENLIVIAATNRPDNLDSAILRSGRFDKKIYIGPPDFEARKELFQIYIDKEDRPHKNLDYDELANLTEGYVAADIETICDDVSRSASKNLLELANILEGDDIDLEVIKRDMKKSIITMDLLRIAISNSISSLKMVDMSIYENWEKSLN